MNEAELPVGTDGPALIVTMYRPERCNTMRRRLGEMNAESFDDLDNRGDLAVAVLVGAGAAFLFRDGSPPISRKRTSFRTGQGFRQSDRTATAKPLIAVVEESALAGEFERVLACDLVVASSHCCVWTS